MTQSPVITASPYANATLTVNPLKNSSLFVKLNFRAVFAMPTSQLPTTKTHAPESKLHAQSFQLLTSIFVLRSNFLSSVDECAHIRADVELVCCLELFRY